jgi:hypothetical protein
LLPEYRGARVYWLYHDNYLAAKVLAGSHPELSAKIRKAIRAAGVTESGKIEIRFGEARRPLPFRRYRLDQVRTVGDKVLKTEVVTDQEFRGWQEYADLLLLAAIACAGDDPAQARRHWATALRTWDGEGFQDRATRKGGRYATYKLALASLAADRLGRRGELPPGVVQRLLALQGPGGGWVTDYTAGGRPVGRANVETTCLAVLALDQWGRTRQHKAR